MTLYKWSQTAASDATADPSINWAEGQSPSSVNDSARAMMAALAKYRDDTGGVISTGGTASAYTVATSQVFDSLAHMDTQSISFAVSSTNLDGATLNVDDLGAKPICVNASGAPIPAGTFVAGTVYQVTYYNGVGQFRLWNLYANPYNVPLGGGLLHFLPTVPNSNFAFANGAAISRATYSVLFGLMGTSYGVGDGSTTFNLPDLRGRVPAMVDGGTGRLTGLIMSPDGNTIGAIGGTQAWALSLGQLPTFTPSVASASVSVVGSALTAIRNWVTGGGGSSDTTHASTGSNLGSDAGTISAPVSASGTPSITMNSVGSNQAHTNVQPTITCNYIIRII